MRILEIVHAFPPLAEGGCEVYADAHARALARRGAEVLVLTREENRAKPEYSVRSEARDGLRIVRLNNTFAGSRSFEDSYRNDTIGALARRIVDDFKPDVAHVHHLTGLSTTIVPALAERDVPCFMTLHDYWLMCHRGQLFDLDHRICAGPGRSAGCGRCLGFQASAPSGAYSAARTLRKAQDVLPQRIGRAVYSCATELAQILGRESPSGGEVEAGRRIVHMREVMSHVTEFFAPSQSLRQRFVGFGVSEDRIHHWPNGFDHGSFDSESARRRQGVEGEPLRVGFIGSLMVSKAPHMVIEAVRALGGRARVDLFGALTPYHGDESYLRRLGPLLQSEGVRYRGPVAHRDVPGALASFDVLVVPSVWPENSPLVIQEAFLARVPVIASRIGGIPELVEHERNGLLFEPGNVEELRHMIERAADEPGLLDRLRSGTGMVRAIEDDVAAACERYGVHLRRPAPRSEAAVTTHADAHGSFRVAAVVLNYRTPDETFLAVRSLAASRRPPDEIIVVDNSGGSEVMDLARLSFASPGRITLLRTDRNLGFPGGVNVGIRSALERGADAVLLVNSDVIVPPDCLDRLESALRKSPVCGIVGPAIASRAAPSITASLGMSYDPTTGRMRHRGFGQLLPPRHHQASDAAQGATSRVDGVSACAMLIRREVFDAIGWFDEDYFFSFEDLDFCLRARRAGFETRLVESVTAYHEGGRSMGPSPRRLYFAARNHLLLASRVGSGSSAPQRWFRASTIVALNVAHAVTANGSSLPQRIAAVLRGTRDYVAGRYGPA